MSSALAASLLELSPVAIVGADRRGRVNLFSPAAEALLGWRTAEVLGHSVRELYVHPDEPRRIWGHIQARSPGLPATEDPILLSLRHRNGTRIPVQLVAVALWDDLGAPLGTLGACTDLREAHAQARRLEGALEQVEASEERLRVLSRLQKALQEAAQPLTSLSMELQMLQENLPPQWRTQVSQSLLQMDILAKRLASVAALLNTPPAKHTSGLSHEWRSL